MLYIIFLEYKLNIIYYENSDFKKKLKIAYFKNSGFR